MQRKFAVIPEELISSFIDRIYEPIDIIVYSYFNIEPSIKRKDEVLEKLHIDEWQLLKSLDKLMAYRWVDYSLFEHNERVFIHCDVKHFA